MSGELHLGQNSDGVGLSGVVVNVHFAGGFGMEPSFLRRERFK